MGYMGRLEKYRNIRRYRRRCALIVLLAFLLVIAGILGADYSVNGLMTDTGRVGIISFNLVDSQLEVCFMNMKFNVRADFLQEFVNFMKGLADFLAWVF